MKRFCYCGCDLHNLKMFLEHNEARPQMGRPCPLANKEDDMSRFGTPSTYGMTDGLASGNGPGIFGSDADPYRRMQLAMAMAGMAQGPAATADCWLVSPVRRRQETRTTARQ
jgi:hypothetical protein